MRGYQPGEPFFMLRNGLSTWLILFGAAFVFSAVLNGAFAIPFGSVVDVVFALQLIFVGLLLLSLAMFVLEAITTGQSAFLSAALLATFLALLFPFAAIGGYRLYASVMGHSVAEATSVYVPFTQTFAGTLIDLSIFKAYRVLGDAISPDAIIRIEAACIAVGLIAAALMTAIFKRR